MKLDISRGILKVISRIPGFVSNLMVFNLFLITSATVVYILIWLTIMLTFILKETGSENVSLPYSPFITGIVFIVVFIIFYSLYIDHKFIRTMDVSPISILVISIISIIVYWIILSIEAFRVYSTVDRMVYCILYIFLLLMLLFIIVWLSMMVTLLFRVVDGHSVNSHFKHARSAIDKIIERHNDEKCLFGWDNIPGKDSEKLVSYLREDRDICWVESKNIRKSEEDQSIHISKDENLIKIMIDEKKEKGILEINKTRICDLKVKKENDRINIYEVTNYKDMYRIYMVSDNYKSGINEIKDLLRRGIDLNRNPNLNEILDQLAFWMQYYLFYGGYEQTESVKKHLDHVPKNFDKQYHINSDQFVYEILRMHGEIDDYFEKNEIRPTCSTGFTYHLIDRLLKKLPEIAALIITVLLIYLLKLVPYTIELLPTKLPTFFL